MNDSSGDRKEGISGQVVVNLTGRLPALGDGPDDERLAPATIAGCENSRNACAELARFRFDIGSRILKDK